MIGTSDQCCWLAEACKSLFLLWLDNTFKIKIVVCTATNHLTALKGVWRVYAFSGLDCHLVNEA